MVLIMAILFIPLTMNRLVEKQCKLEQEALSDNHPKLDLKFKEGQTIKVNLNIVSGFV